MNRSLDNLTSTHRLFSLSPNGGEGRGEGALRPAGRAAFEIHGDDAGEDEFPFNAETQRTQRNAEEGESHNLSVQSPVLGFSSAKLCVLCASALKRSARTPERGSDAAARPLTLALSPDGGEGIRRQTSHAPAFFGTHTAPPFL